MNIKMNHTKMATEDGHSVQMYKKGQTYYNVTRSLAVDLCANNGAKVVK